MNHRLALTALIVLTTGCGTSAAKTVTVSGPVPTTGASNPPPIQITPASELRMYLRAMTKAEKQWNHAQAAWRKALDPLTTYTDTTDWPLAAQKLEFVRRRFDASAIYVEGVHVPPSLAKAHAKWLLSLTLASADADAYETAFKTKDSSAVYRLDQNDPRLTQMGTPRTSWRISVTTLAKKLSVPVPESLRLVGTGY